MEVPFCEICESFCLHWITSIATAMRKRNEIRFMVNGFKFDGKINGFKNTDDTDLTDQGVFESLK
jgi:hypothetical protein